MRQVLAYAAQSTRTPAVALFGKASPDEVLRVYLKLRDGRPPIQLWWYSGARWEHITARARCRAMPASVPQLTIGRLDS